MEIIGKRGALAIYVYKKFSTWFSTNLCGIPQSFQQNEGFQHKGTLSKSF